MHGFHYLIFSYDLQVDNTNFTSEGQTPLYIASKQGDLELCKILIQAGALASVSCDDGTTPLFIASQQGHLPIVKYLIQMARGRLYTVIDKNYMNLDNSHQTAFTGNETLNG